MAIDDINWTIKSPLVTVYIPTRNRLALLRRAIKSVLEQTYKNTELIVVDDASTDGTQRYLKEMQNRGLLRAFFSPACFGACVARNFAITRSKGLFVTGLDDDDYILPNRIESFLLKWQQLQLNNQSKSVSGLFDDMTVIGCNGEWRLHSYPLSVSDKDLIATNSIGNQVFAPKQHYLDAGMFDPCMPIWQDWDLWIRMSRTCGEFINLGIGTYIVDQSHGYDRITSKPEFVIRYAMKLAEAKNGVYSKKDRTALLVACLCYPQVKPNLSDIYQLAKSGRYRDVLFYMTKLF